MGFENNTGTGSVAHYGPRTTNESFGGSLTNRAGKTTVVYEFDYDDLPSAASIDLDHVYPAGAIILAARFVVITGFTSTSTDTDLTVGIADADGGSNVTDVDGIFTATELTQTVIAAAGLTVAAAGDNIGTAEDEAMVLTVTPTVDDLLTGKARIEVDYMVAPA